MLLSDVSVFSDESRVVQPIGMRQLYYLLVVSVFSDESRVVQLPASAGGSGKPVVSVFSDESRVVQRVISTVVPAAAGGFQYSLTNLVWCNPAFVRMLNSHDYVSVFSDESRVVQRIAYLVLILAMACFSIL